MSALPEVDHGPYVVSPAQRRVLVELARDGAPNGELAERLYIGERTVKFHLMMVGKRTGCRTRTALALWWIRCGQYAGEE